MHLDWAYVGAAPCGDLRHAILVPRKRCRRTARAAPLDCAWGLRPTRVRVRSLGSPRPLEVSFSKARSARRRWAYGRCECRPAECGGLAVHQSARDALLAERRQRCVAAHYAQRANERSSPAPRLRDRHNRLVGIVASRHFASGLRCGPGWMDGAGGGSGCVMATRRAAAAQQQLADRPAEREYDQPDKEEPGGRVRERPSLGSM